MTEEHFREWHLNFTKDYAIRLDFDKTLANLVRCGIILISDGLIHFKYKYFYYYFAARHLAQNIIDSRIRAGVSSIVDQLYHEDYANIIVFLCHFSRDPFIIDELLRSARAIYSSDPMCNLGECQEQFQKIFSQYVPSALVDSRKRSVYRVVTA